MDISGRLEEIILNQLVRNQDFYKDFVGFIEKEYFNDRTEQRLFVIIQEHSKKYNARITPQIIKAELLALTGISQTDHDEAQLYVDKVISDEFVPPTLKWLIEKADKWCSDHSLENAIFESVNIFHGQSTEHSRDEIPDMLRASLSKTRNISVGHDFFTDIETRWEKLNTIGEKLPFNIEILDTITKGGIDKKTLNCVMAATGIGKSIFLCHCAANTIQNGQDVLYITAEMDEYKIANRIDANLLDVSLDVIQTMKKDEFVKLWSNAIHIHQYRKKSYGRLKIKQFPTGMASVTDFRKLLVEYEIKQNFKPRLIIIDYLNICSSFRFTNAGAGLYSYIKAIAEEFRGLAIEYDVPILTATQVNRSGTDASDFGMNATSESLGLAHTLDLFLALIDPDDAANASQRIICKQLKNRYGSLTYPAKKFYLGLEKEKMRFFGVDDWQVNVDNSKPSKRKNLLKKAKEITAPESDIPLFDLSTGGAFNPMGDWATQNGNFAGITM